MTKQAAEENPMHMKNHLEPMLYKYYFVKQILNSIWTWMVIYPCSLLAPVPSPFQPCLVYATLSAVTFILFTMVLSFNSFHLLLISIRYHCTGYCSFDHRILLISCKISVFQWKSSIQREDVYVSMLKSLCNISRICQDNVITF